MNQDAWFRQSTDLQESPPQDAWIASVSQEQGQYWFKDGRGKSKAVLDINSGELVVLKRIGHAAKRYQVVMLPMPTVVKTQVSMLLADCGWWLDTNLEWLE